MLERPGMFIRFASLYSCSRVRPFVRLVPERCPPRRPGDMSLRDRRDEDLASPACARVLLTFRAAISFARFVERPCFFSDSLTCSYWRSRFALHADWGMSKPSSNWTTVSLYPIGRSLLQRRGVGIWFVRRLL